MGGGRQVVEVVSEGVVVGEERRTGPDLEEEEDHLIRVEEA